MRVGLPTGNDSEWNPITNIVKHEPEVCILDFSQIRMRWYRKKRGKTREAGKLTLTKYARVYAMLFGDACLWIRRRFPEERMASRPTNPGNKNRKIFTTNHFKQFDSTASSRDANNKVRTMNKFVNRCDRFVRRLDMKAKCDRWRRQPKISGRIKWYRKNWGEIREAVLRQFCPFPGDEVAPDQALSQVLNSNGKVSIKMMVNYKQILQAGTTTHSERVISLNPKFALAQVVRDPTHRVKFPRKDYPESDIQQICTQINTPSIHILHKLAPQSANIFIEYGTFASERGPICTRRDDDPDMGKSDSKLKSLEFFVQFWGHIIF
ncbi:hypothetical protein B0H14DRAFT_2578835 [Mycena olivaceomarginata]|nr:hypothetical protein B0H14DRAFT_2578835 [Mycena olivaceomarginata]